MNKYVVFIKHDRSRVIEKELATHSLIKEMNQQGFTKHHISVEAETEKEAIEKLNKHSEEQLNSLSDFSSEILICSVCVVVVTLICFFN